MASILLPPESLAISIFICTVTGEIPGVLSKTVKTRSLVRADQTFAVPMDKVPDITVHLRQDVCEGVVLHHSVKALNCRSANGSAGSLRYTPPSGLKFQLAKAGPPDVSTI